MTATKKDNSKSISYLSWITATIGFLIVLGGIVFLLFKTFESKPELPKISVQVVSITKENNNYLVMIEVENKGATVSSLAIEGELKQGTESIEKSSVKIAYVPEASIRRAGIYFTNNPKQFKFTLMPISFEVP